MNRVRRRRRAGGFTIIELMVVVAIIGLLAAIAVPRYLKTLQQAKENRIKHDLRVLRDLIQQFRIDKRRCPDELGELVSAGYLADLPKDPLSETSETWVAVPEEQDELAEDVDPEAEACNVADVFLDIDGIGLDGIAYRDY